MQNFIHRPRANLSVDICAVAAAWASSYTIWWRIDAAVVDSCVSPAAVVTAYDTNINFINNAMQCPSTSHSTTALLHIHFERCRNSLPCCCWQQIPVALCRSRPPNVVVVVHVLLKYLNEYIWFYAICICKARMRVIFLASSHSFNSFPSTNLLVGKKKNRTQFAHTTKKMRMRAVLTLNFINIACKNVLKVRRLYKFAWEYVSLRPTTDDARGKNGTKLNRVARRKQKKFAFAQCATKVFVCCVRDSAYPRLCLQWWKRCI